MAQEWFYTTDGKSRIGPISEAGLKALAASGELAPTHMVWKEGMAKWMEASAIKGLFTMQGCAAKPPDEVQIKARPVPSPRSTEDQRSAMIVILASRVALGLAVFISLVAALLAMLSFVGLGTVLAILAILVASVGVFAGLIAVGVGLSTRKGRLFMETAAVAGFVGLAALFFSICATMTARAIKEYREIAGKASEVEEDRTKAENARREAKLFKADAEKARDDILDRPKQILKEAQDVRLQNDNKLAEIKSEHAVLNKKRVEIDDEIRVKRANADEDIKAKQSDLAAEQGALAKRQKSVGEMELSLRKRENEIFLAMKKTQELKDEAARLKSEADKLNNQAVGERAKAENKQQEADAALKQSNVKEKEAMAYYKKIKNELKDVVKPKSKEAMNTIQRIGRPPEGATLHLCDITYDLCEVAASEAGVKDKKLRQEAVNAIFTMDRALGELTTSMLKPPDDTTFDKFVETINELPKFGPAGVPLIEGLLAARNFKAAGKYEIFEASIEVLAKIAKDDDRALRVLTRAQNCRMH